MTEPTVDLPSYAPAPGEFQQANRPRSGVVAALVVGIVGLFASAVFALALFGGEGGASTPEDAVHQMLDAVEQEDVIGVLESLAPGERDAMRDPVEDVASELKRLGILDEGFDLGKIGGVDVEFENVELSSESIADHLAAVQIVGGTARATTTPDELPIGPVLRDLMSEFGADEIEPSATTEDLAEGEVTIATVKAGGRWYVSLFYSIAETARRAAGEPLPDFGSGVPAEGAESPEAAVEGLLHAAVDLDVRRLIALTPPDEMAALHDYAPLFLDDAEEDIAGLREGGFDLHVDGLELDTDVDADRARVAFKAVAFSGVVDGEAVSFSWDGECVRVEAPQMGVEEQCRGDEPSADDEMLFPIPAGLGSLQFSLTAVQVDGAWYVSPTGSVLDLVVDVLRGLEREDVENIGDFFSGFFPFFGTSSSESFSSVGGSIEVEPGDDELVPPTAGVWLESDDATLEPDAQFECYSMFEEAEPATEDEYRAIEAEVERCLEAARGG